jgi:TNF receptor-associated factor 4
MQHHLDNECNKHEIACPFADSNCPFKSLRSEMGKHLKESPGIHLNLMCKTIGLQKQQLQIISEIIDAQKDQLMKLNNKMMTIEKLNGSQIIWKIDKYMEKLAESKTGKKPIIFSPPFFTSSHGYKLCLSTNLFGDGKCMRLFKAKSLSNPYQYFLS